MKYMGSKNRISKELLEIILPYRKEGHTVFVSEYNAPDDFICVWQKQVNSSLTKDTGDKKAVEKLFMYQLK